MGSTTEMSDLQTAIRQPLRAFLTAVGFLTIIPATLFHKQEQLPFGAALYYFPAVGLCIGFIAAAAGIVLNTAANPLISCVILALLLSGLSGFLHMDGLADTADGFLSARGKQRCLEIMKDSRIGVMGAVALCSVLLLKTAALYSIAPEALTGSLIVAAGAGRSALVVTMFFLPYARPEGGLGQLFLDNEGGLSPLVVSIVFLLGVIVIVLPAKLVTSIFMFGLVLGLFSIWCLKKIGGYTGDTLGCLCELIETGLLIGLGFTW